MSELISNNLYRSIKQIIENVRNNVHRAVNSAMVDAYWHIGKLLVNEEQQGKQRAELESSLSRKYPTD